MPLRRDWLPRHHVRDLGRTTDVRPAEIPFPEAKSEFRLCSWLHECIVCGKPALVGEFGRGGGGVASKKSKKNMKKPKKLLGAKMLSMATKK